MNLTLLNYDVDISQLRVIITINYFHVSLPFSSSWLWNNDDNDDDEQHFEFLIFFHDSYFTCIQDGWEKDENFNKFWRNKFLSLKTSNNKRTLNCFPIVCPYCPWNSIAFRS